MNFYIYCKKNNRNFVIDSDEWIYASKLGWEDYFSNINIINENNSLQENIIKYAGFEDIFIEEYPIYEYKNYLWDIYKYNDNTKKIILEKKKELNIFNTKYGGIYIRRGDKLYSESKLFDSIVYLKLLLSKYPECQKIFLQTDDYTCYEELIDYIKNNELNIEIITLCNKNSRGVIVNEDYNLEQPEIIKNKEYIDKIIDILKNTKKVVDMDSEEIYNHTIDIIVGLDIILNSEICVLDYQSNVSRFIKLAHKKYENVFDITEIDVDLNKKKCPALVDSFYNNHDEWFHSYL